MVSKEYKEKQREYNRKYREKQREKLKSVTKQDVFTLAGQLGSGTLDLLGKMMESALSNPLMGIVSAIVIGDILYRAKIIDIQSYTAIMVSVGVLEGTAVAGTVIQDVSDFFKVFQGQSQTIDPITPTASTVVTGGSQRDLQALMSQLVNNQGGQ